MNTISAMSMRAVRWFWAEISTSRVAWPAGPVSLTLRVGRGRAGRGRASGLGSINNRDAVAAAPHPPMTAALRLPLPLHSQLVLAPGASVLSAPAATALTCRRCAWRSRRAAPPSSSWRHPP